MKFYKCVEREINPDTFSRAIQIVIDAPYSHSLILVSDIPEVERVRHNLPMEGDVVFHATTPVYRFNSLASELEGGRNEIYSKVEIKVYNDFFALGWLIGNMGKEYSFSQCVGLLDFSIMGKDFCRNILRIWSNGNGKGICSEFSFRFGLENSVRPDLFMGIDPEGVNPKTGLEFYQKLALITG